MVKLFGRKKPEPTEAVPRPTVPPKRTAVDARPKKVAPPPRARPPRPPLGSNQAGAPSPSPPREAAPEPASLFEMRPSGGYPQPPERVDNEPAKRKTPTEEIDALIERLEHIVGPDGTPDPRPRKPRL